MEMTIIINIGLAGKFNPMKKERGPVSRRDGGQCLRLAVHV